ncbi:retrovirus-related pol polyprotein from transposon TNT 1-94 [Tanacetum coccineum]
MVVNDSVTSELARYKELVGEKETSLKSELHSTQILLSSTVDHYKSKTEEVTLLKKDFKQKEDKFLEEFLDIQKLKDKIEDRLYKQDQSVQTVHMLCKPKSFYNEMHKVAIGYKNPVCLARAKQAQSAMYNGHVLVTTIHTPIVIHDSEDTRELAEITRNKMLLKMQSPLKRVSFGKTYCGSQWRSNRKEMYLANCRTGHPLVSGLRLFKTYDGESFKAKNFVEKVMGHQIMEYLLGDMGQFCDSDLEVAFRKHTCFVRDINGTDILKGSRSTNLYTISIDEMMKSSPICLLSKASKSKSWLWHRRLNHLNFGTINDLARKDLVRGLPRLKFEKDHLCSACQLGKSKKFSHRPKSENTNMEVLHTLHMDLCGPMRVQSIKGKKYILVIVDDYSRFTWVKFLRSKDETPEFVINFLKQMQVGLNKTVRFIRTDNGTEFVNQVMSEYYEGVGIFHQKSVPRTPQQNGVVERRNRTLMEAARTMMIFSKAPMFLWAEAVATALFGALCYPTNDSEDLGKFQAKADIGIFVGYAPSRKGYRIYNKRTRRLMETIHVTFDEMHQKMAPVRMSSGPEPFIMTPGQLKSGLAPTDKELEMLFQPMFDEYLKQSQVNKLVPSATEINAQVIPPGTSLSTTIAQDAPSTSTSSSTSDMHHPVRHQEIAEEPTHEDPPINHDVLHPSHNLVTGELGSAQSSSRNVNSAEPNQVNYPPDHLRRWTKDHPLDNIIGNPSRPVSTRKQLA